MSLYDAHFLKNPEFPDKEYERFSMGEIDRLNFRPSFVSARKTYQHWLKYWPYQTCVFVPKADGIGGLCCVLKRFAYSCSYSDMIPLFGRTVPELSMISNVVVDYIYNQHSHKLLQWNDMSFHHENLQAYANAIHCKGAALNNCIGFVDETMRPISRTRKLQRSVYSGHKRIHAFKFQSVQVRI